MHQSYAEEQTKISREAKFATLGRAIADAVLDGGSAAVLIREAALRRQQEYERGDRAARFAALARQVGDAFAQERDLKPLVGELVDLRRREIG
jgi:cell division inhibitor SulA